MKHILIVESYSVVRLATKTLLRDLYKDAVIHEASSFGDGLSEMKTCRQDLIILDTYIPGNSGLKVVELMRTIQKNVPILIFSAIEERIYGIHYLRSGANGFVSKNATIAELREAILSVAETGRYVSHRIGVELLNQLDKYNYHANNPLLGLSSREITIMDLLMKGLWIKEIASKLDLKTSSISTYKERLFEKLQVSSLVEMFQKVKFYKEMD